MSKIEYEDNNGRKLSITTSDLEQFIHALDTIKSIATENLGVEDDNIQPLNESCIKGLFDDDIETEDDLDELLDLHYYDMMEEIPEINIDTDDYKIPRYVDSDDLLCNLPDYAIEPSIWEIQCEYCKHFSKVDALTVSHTCEYCNHTQDVTSNHTPVNYECPLCGHTHTVFLVSDNVSRMLRMDCPICKHVCIVTYDGEGKIKYLR